MHANNWLGKSDLEIMVDIGQRIRLLRMSENLTQQLLAEQTGLNRSTIRDIETGKPINLLSLLAVLRRLNGLERLEESLPNAEDNPVLAMNQRHRKRVKLLSKKTPF